MANNQFKFNTDPSLKQTLKEVLRAGKCGTLGFTSIITENVEPTVQVGHKVVGDGIKIVHMGAATLSHFVVEGTRALLSKEGKLAFGTDEDFNKRSGEENAQVLTKLFTQDQQKENEKIRRKLQKKQAKKALKEAATKGKLNPSLIGLETIAEAKDSAIGLTQAVEKAFSTKE